MKKYVSAMLLAALVLPDSYAQDCASLEARTGIVETIALNNDLEDGSYYGPTYVGLWWSNALFRSGNENVEGFVSLLEDTALNASAVYNCQPGTHELVEELRARVPIRQNAQELSEFGYRNPYEWATYSLMYTTSSTLERLLYLEIALLGSDRTIAPEDITRAENIVEAVADRDWRGNWLEQESLFRENNFWGEKLRSSFSSE